MAALRIHVSQSTAASLLALRGYDLQKRGTILVKVRPTWCTHSTCPICVSDVDVEKIDGMSVSLRCDVWRAPRSMWRLLWLPGLLPSEKTTWFPQMVKHGIYDGKHLSSHLDQPLGGGLLSLGQKLSPGFCWNTPIYSFTKQQQVWA